MLIHAAPEVAFGEVLLPEACCRAKFPIVKEREYVLAKHCGNVKELRMAFARRRYLAYFALSMYFGLVLGYPLWPCLCVSKFRSRARVSPAEVIYPWPGGSDGIAPYSCLPSTSFSFHASPLCRSAFLPAFFSSLFEPFFFFFGCRSK